MSFKIRIQLLEGCSTGTLNEPTYATQGSAGFDIYANKFLKMFDDKYPDSPIEGEGLDLANERGSIVISPHARILIGAGYRIEIPEGFELQVRSRSGCSLKQGIVVLNQPGTIDSDYRGEVGMILYNTSSVIQTIELGKAYAQGIISPIVRAEFIPVEELTTTERGEGGFGSTNK